MDSMPAAHGVLKTVCSSPPCERWAPLALQPTCSSTLRAWSMLARGYFSRSVPLWERRDGKRAKGSGKGKAMLYRI